MVLDEGFAVDFLKPWKEMTVEEILELKRKQCKGCIFFKCRNRHSVGGDSYCDYLLMMGRLRGGDPRECEKRMTIPESCRLCPAFDFKGREGDFYTGAKCRWLSLIHGDKNIMIGDRGYLRKGTRNYRCPLDRKKDYNYLKEVHHEHN